MTKRPFLSLGVAELEKKFDAGRRDQALLRAISEELTHRKTQRAADLAKRVTQAIGVAPKQAPKATATRPAAPFRSEGLKAKPSEKAEPFAPNNASPQKPCIPMDIGNLSEPERIMLTWTALEVLSPQSFNRREDLVSGDRYRIASLEDSTLPWENGAERSKKNYRLYYQIVLGTIDMERAVKSLLQTYVDKREERPAARGQGIIATVTVDKNGRIIDKEEGPIALSSFAWGAPIALTGNLKGLGDWSNAERSITDALDQRLRRHGDDGEITPLTKVAISDAYQWLTHEFGLSEDLLNPPSFAVRAYQYFKVPEPPDSLVMNSFFLDDLHQARLLFSQGRATENMSRYIGAIQPASREDLLRNEEAFSRVLHPVRIPLARWPGDGRHPLVALQQAAVNLSASDLKEGGILGVNGPPGTGKTTLLRDVVAHVVTDRARAMAQFDDPEAAFSNTKQRISKGNAFLWIYQLDPSLRGYEMVVASSNNKAVENVSAELPGLDAVAADAFPSGYFKTVSSKLLERETWGMVAAVLGNAKNRSEFRRTFWWDEDYGLARYLQHASGAPKLVVEEDENGRKIERPPIIVSQEDPPSDHSQALRRWRIAKEEFLSCLKAAEELLSVAEETANLPAEIQEIESVRSSVYE